MTRDMGAFVARNFRVDRRRPAAPLQVTASNNNDTLTWVPPTDMTGITHWRVRINTDYGNPAFEVPAGQTTVPLPPGSLAAVSAYNAVTGVESPRTVTTYQKYGETSPTQTISAAGDKIDPNAGIVRVYSLSNRTLTGTPTIKAGTNGQVLIVENIGPGILTFQDAGTLASSGLNLKHPNVVLTQYEAMVLVYSTDRSEWNLFALPGRNRVNVHTLALIGAVNAADQTYSHFGTDGIRFKHDVGDSGADLSIIVTGDGIEITGRGTTKKVVLSEIAQALNLLVNATSLPTGYGAHIDRTTAITKLNVGGTSTPATAPLGVEGDCDLWNGVYQVNGDQVVGARLTAIGAAPAAPSGTAGATYGATEQTLINDLVTFAGNVESKLNDIIARLGITAGHGLTAD